MDRPTYKRSVTRRESYRVDFDADGVRAALSLTMDEEIPETAAFRLHDDGGATFCWDVDYDVDGPSIQRVEPTKPDQDGRTTINVVPLIPFDESSPNGRPMELPSDAQGGIAIPSDGLRETLVDAALGRKPTAQVVKVDTATLDAEDPDRDRERLTNIATGRARSMSHFGGTHAPSEVGISHFQDERGPNTAPPIHSDADQCKGIFRLGVTRMFRCHLDLGHDGPCGAAEGCEPEDPPEGRRRS